MLTNVFEMVLCLFIVVAVIKLVQSLVRSSGLLTGKRGSHAQFERIPLLVLLLVGATVYAILAVGNLRADNPVFPQAPDVLLWLLGGSQLLYLIGKYLRNR